MKFKQLFTENKEIKSDGVIKIFQTISQLDKTIYNVVHIQSESIMQTFLKKKYAYIMMDELQKRDDYKDLKTDILKDRKMMKKWYPIIRSYDDIILDQRKI